MRAHTCTSSHPQHRLTHAHTCAHTLTHAYSSPTTIAASLPAPRPCQGSFMPLVRSPPSPALLTPSPALPPHPARPCPLTLPLPPSRVQGAVLPPSVQHPPTPALHFSWSLRVGWRLGLVSRGPGAHFHTHRPDQGLPTPPSGPPAALGGRPVHPTPQGPAPCSQGPAGWPLHRAGPAAAPVPWLLQTRCPRPMGRSLS